MIAATKNFIKDADVDSGNTRIAIITYSTEVRVEFDLRTYHTKDELLAAVDRIKYIYGDTNTAGALKTMRTRIFSTVKGDRERVPNVAVIVTDGESNINHTETIPEAKLARQAGIEIYAIGVGVSKVEELNGIAGKPENRFDIEKFEQLEYNLDSVYKSLCIGNGYLILDSFFYE
jgi:collagen type VI alpha